ncbi:hypothetical protein G4B88_015303 [Cannabis sativa]|uniref:Cytochrome P450 n=1 Tax=Cannabis sativa TaxID=3483 RepID=A0A7J6EFL6_CANSA|nr:hypothetical protein G4B88_015303 [Cannabis sativa]
MPFGVGTRICIGQNMAMTELKVVLSLILSKFSFSVSPAYRHSAVFGVVIESEHGVNLQVVKQKTDAADEKNLLKMILEGAKAFGGVDSPSLGLTQDKFIVDNCKKHWYYNILGLVAWQTRVREEVKEVCKNGSPDANMLRSMKVLTMVIQETLRLYPSIVYVLRNALQDVQYKDILVPKE